MNYSPHRIAGVLLLALSITGSLWAFQREEEKAISQYSLRVWQREQGLPQNSVNAILQTRDGYMWLGTQEGVVRFDGVHFTVFNKKNTPSLKSNYVWTLYEDTDGVLWIGTNGGGLTRYDGSTFTSSTTHDNLSGNVIRIIMQDRTGTMWVGTNGGLDRVTSRSPFTCVNVPEFRNDNIIAVFEDNEQTLWIGSDHGLREFRNGTVRTLRLHNGPSDGDIRMMLQDNQGTIWIGSATGKGFLTFAHGMVNKFDAQPELLTVPILSIAQDQSGGIWFGTAGKGLWRYGHGQWSNFTMAQGLSDNQVKSICIDRENNVWLGTYGGGLNQLTDGSFTTFSKTEGLTNDFVLSVSQATDGSMLIGTYGGGLNRLKAGTCSPIPFRDTPSNVVITSALEDHRGTIWIGRHGVGLFKLDRNGSMTQLGVSAGFTTVAVYALFEDRNGAMWIGSDDAVYRYQRGTLKSFNRDNAGILGSVECITEDSAGRIWLGTSGHGLYRIIHDAVARFTVQDGLSSNSVISLLADSNRTLWIGTEGGGLQRYDDTHFVTVSSQDGLFDDVIFSILDDGIGNVWMSSNNGVFAVSKLSLMRFGAESSKTISCTVYGTAEGMKSSECNGRRQPSAWKNRDGNLWFATLHGVAMVNPSRLRRNANPPSVLLEQLLVDGTSVTLKDGFEIGPASDKLEFHYTALSFVAPEKVRFKYLLEGYDRSWIDADTRRVAYYTNLPSRSYRFRVIACNNDNLWNETGASISFELKPWFYQTFWFFGLCVVAAAGTGYGWYTMRIRHLRNRERELVQMVEERTHRLLEEKTRAEEAFRHAEEARKETERQKEVAEEANKVKSHLLHIAAHDLKSPLISIKGFARIIRDELAWETPAGKMAEMIQSLTTNMISLVNQLLNSASIESGRMVLLRNKVDAVQLVRSAVLSTYMQVKAKDQKLNLDVDPWGLCIVDGDEARLRDAFENLLTNAIKYSPREAAIDISVRRNDDRVCLTVRDYGPGLTEEDKSKLFGKFQRLSAQPTGGEPSTGLGLSIAKEIVELHGGRILVESEAGKGSVFTIELPWQGDQRQPSGQ